jgi:hypothetical protein
VILFLTSEGLPPLFLAPIQPVNSNPHIQQMSFEYVPRKGRETNLRNGKDEARNEIIGFGAKRN